MNMGAGEGYPDDDRLPWLETVDEDYSEGPSLVRIALMILVGLAIIAAAIFGYYWYQQRDGASGTGALINAQEGDYKVKPDEPGGMKVEGEGDTVFATSEGATTNGSVDVRAVPEAPVAGKAAPAPKASPATGARKVVTSIPDARGTLQAQAPAVAPSGPKPRAGGGGGAVVQLGSFPNESGANDAWTRLSKRFGYLAGLGKSVERAEVNGRTVYRLRVNAGSAGQAGDICGKLKVAGEPCFVPNG
jgi:hypothetical protein